MKTMRIETAGFFDLQVNGFGGVDFNNPSTSIDDLRVATELLRATGVTRFLPTLITSPLDSFSTCAQTLSASGISAIAGIHMEGPYISSEDGPRGAHPREHVSLPSIEDFKRRQDAAAGTIVLVTLAPELPGSTGLIEYLVESGVRVAIGHTAAAPHQISAAIKAGASLSTHLGNGCAQMMKRHPNPIWEQLASDELYMSLIVDGHHLPPTTVKAMIRAKGPERTLLVTDATAAAGCPPGRYFLGGAEVELSESGRVAVPGAPNLAGSALSLDQGISKTVRFSGLNVDEVLPMASTIPASYLGVSTSGRVEFEWDAAAFNLQVTRVFES